MPKKSKAANTIPISKVDLITGPGNHFVANFWHSGYRLAIAGPSEKFF